MSRPPQFAPHDSDFSSDWISVKSILLFHSLALSDYVVDFCSCAENSVREFSFSSFAIFLSSFSNSRKSELKVVAPITAYFTCSSLFSSLSIITSSFLQVAWCTFAEKGIKQLIFPFKFSEIVGLCDSSVPPFFIFSFVYYNTCVGKILWLALLRVDIFCTYHFFTSNRTLFATLL